MHHAHASASCPRHFFYPSLIATQKEVKYGLKKDATEFIVCTRHRNCLSRLDQRSTRPIACYFSNHGLEYLHNFM